MEKDFKFKITFSCEKNLQGEKLKHSIDDYHYLTPGTTKRIKSKPSKDDDDEGITLMIALLVLSLVFRYLTYLKMKNIKGKLLGMIQRINCMKLNMKMVIKKNFTIMRSIAIGIKPRTHRLRRMYHHFLQNKNYLHHPQNQINQLPQQIYCHLQQK